MMRGLFWAVLGVIATLALTGCNDEEGVFTSPNGQKFSFLQRPDAKIVAIQLAFPMDWVLQAGHNPYVPQIAAEVMMTGGAEGYGPAEILETMQDLDAQAFLYPQFTALRGGLNVAPENLDQVITLANAVLRAPTFDETWMGRSTEGLIARTTEARTIPAKQGYEALRLAMMGDTAYTAAQSLAAPALLAQVTADMARQWHKQTVVAGRVVVAVAGPISAEKAGQAVDALLAGLDTATGDFSEPKAAPYQPRQVLLHIPQAKKTTLTLLSPIPPTGGPDDISDLVGAMVLGADDQAVLFEEIRTKLRATYGLRIALDNYARKSRVFVVTGDVDTAKTAQVRDVVQQAYTKMAQGLQDAALIERHKSAILGGLSDWHNNTTALAKNMVEAVLDGQDPMTVTKIADLINRVTPLRIQERWQKDYAKAEDLMIFAVSPAADALPGACVITDARQVLTCP